ncbi:putative transcription factor bHLH family [Rosa chinensis]|uniref:Putative transcription factor bHLH family n=1 Tax=Rosa chinensis TaxID=74649 RepID=A0A2P6PHD2_ROSCH|nr:transcription factor bHLH96 [Rosa chinensis]PRQ21341.1 putative transcription factor bHLH family [Rosa chinensis]
MALEAVVYPKDYNPFSYVCKDFYSLAPSNWGYDFSLQENIQDKALVGLLDHQYNNIHHHQGSLNENWEYNCSSSPPSLLQNVKEWDPHSSPEALETPPPPPPPATTGRRKRRRTRSSKNKEEMENQRMTHIVVERNRRKQMNEYLAVLRSLMPTSYVQRGDQASIIGGAINFVKELEQLLQSMDGSHKSSTKPEQVPLAEFFTFPQFSTPATTQCNSNTSSSSSSSSEGIINDEPSLAPRSNNNNNQWPAADIEVTMVDSHANLKILSKKRPRQLLKMVAGFQSLGLSVLHLNVTTVDEMVLYSVSVKIEEGCLLNTVDEIAAAVNEMLRRIQEAGFS